MNDNVVKPIKDWTIEEAKRACISQGDNCAGCPLWLEHGAGCALNSTTPSAWLIGDTAFTSQEVKQAKAVQILQAENPLIEQPLQVRRGHDGRVAVYKNEEANIPLMELPDSCFPSIGEGDSELISYIASLPDDD